MRRGRIIYFKKKNGENHSTIKIDMKTRDICQEHPIISAQMTETRIPSSHRIVFLKPTKQTTF